MMRTFKLALCVLLGVLCAAPVAAHRASDSFVTLTVDGAPISGQWEIALRDLAAADPVDADGDLRLTWGELNAALPALRLRLHDWLRVDADGAPCTLVVDDLLVNDRLDGRYAWLSLSAVCGDVPRQLGVDYRFLADIDPGHRGILVLAVAGGPTQTAVLGPQQPRIVLAPGATSRLSQFNDYLREGVHHIWVGIDHVLFLLSLLLPAVLLRDARRWRPVPDLRTALVEVTGVVTAFTLAHSVTLSLAALDVVRLPSRLVESAIAASVVLAAANNLVPVVTRRRWAMAIVFGLVHGFGFASVLAEMGLPTQARLLSLIGFNVGVEVGQVAIVLVFVPLAYVFRHSTKYERWLLRPGSAILAMLALVWLIERAVGL